MINKIDKTNKIHNWFTTFTYKIDKQDLHVRLKRNWNIWNWNTGLRNKFNIKVYIQDWLTRCAYKIGKQNVTYLIDKQDLPTIVLYKSKVYNE